MLSNIATTTHLNRPRPPGSRRSSANKVEKIIQSQELHQDENEPLPLKSSPRRASTSYTKQMEMERDLELDLPLDFTAALKPRFWPPSRKSTIPSAQKKDAKSTILGGSLGRKQGSGVKDGQVNCHQLFKYTNSQEENLDTDELHNISPVNASEDENEIPAAMESEIESEISMDSEWVGDLPRDELEILLMQANRVIKDRERDLAIAATVGQALLEKNISLRSKHQGIMSRLSSFNSFSQFNNDEDIPRFTPPDTDLNGMDESEKGTPTPNTTVDEYFEGDLNEESAFKSNSNRAPLPTHWTATDSESRNCWNLPKDYFVPSVPASPASSRHFSSQDHSQGQLQFSNETQRQLDMLSEQNEALLEQLSELQIEAEEAKKSGGKKLKKLNREIDGLRTELESATERNFELERVADEGNKINSDEENSARARGIWKRRGTGRQFSNEEEDTSHQSSSTVRGSDEVALEAGEEAGSHSIVEDHSGAGTSFPRSESSLSTTTQSKVISESERALVAQLMGKIRELEETNATLALAGTEMDGRIGKAMEEGERIRDAYDAVENVAAFEESQMKRDDSDLIETHYTGSPYSCSSLVSPVSQRNRRAPGNRYHIEGRRTVRAALNKERNQDGYYYDSNDSSLAPSPVKGGKSQNRSLRPRILITPSTEDLRARAMGDSMADWEDTDRESLVGENVMSSTPRKQQMYYERGQDGDYSSMRTFDSIASMTYHGRKSLGSELESVFGEDNQMNASLTPMMRRQSSPTKSLRYSDLQQNLISDSINLRSRASLNSLRAPSEAESDIADLKWSVSSDTTIQADDGLTVEAGSGRGFDDTVRELAVITASNYLQPFPSITDEIEDGNWYSTNNDDFLPRGCLQNELESTHDSYEWIEKVTRKMPLQWADDDDFGKPITERDARQLGLLEAPSSKLQQQQQKASGLVAWVQGKSSKEIGVKGKMRDANQIQSREQVEERDRLSDLLREKRIVAVQKRVLSGQISTGRAREMGVEISQGQSKSIKQFGETSLEEEVTQRAIAYSTARSRRLRAARGIKDVNKVRKDDVERSDEEFELLDLDPSKRKLGRKGTDYYPITLKERYKPTMVKQRAKHFSGEAITWASAWATFSLVMVFAFLVTFSRGPKRVLNGQTTKR